MTRMPQRTERTIHIRYAGRSCDITAEVLGLAGEADAAAVKRAVARYLDVTPASLDAYVVEFHATGNVTVRPEAVFG